MSSKSRETLLSAKWTVESCSSNAKESLVQDSQIVDASMRSMKECSCDCWETFLPRQDLTAEQVKMLARLYNTPTVAEVGEHKIIDTLAVQCKP